MLKTGVTWFLCIIIPLVLGSFAYHLSACKVWTLVLDAYTLESGTGHVMVYGESAVAPTVVSFAFDTKDNLLVIELPATRVISLKIAPLAATGEFEIKKVTLANDAMSYIWDSQAGGVRKTLSGGKVRRESCSADCPAITTADDGTVTISAIPDAGMERSGGARILLAVAMALLSLVGVAWVLHPLGETVGRGFHYYGVRTAWVAFYAIYSCQFCLIYAYSVDVPYHDDWLYFLPDALTHDFPLKWITSHFLEHRIIPTKLMAWLNLQLFGLDFRLQKIVNYSIFGAMLWTTVVLKNIVAGRKAFPYFPLFLVFLLSPISWENHRWGFQSQIHFVLLFSNVALSFLYRGANRKNLLLFFLYANLAMYSFAAGLILAVVGFCFYLLYACAGIVRKDPAAVSWRRIAQGSLILIVSILLWFNGYQKPDHPLWSQEFYVYPTELDFWGYFLNQMSYFFGSEDYRGLYGSACLLLVVLPLMLLMKKRETRWLPSTWTIVTAVAFILAVLVSISMSRTYINAQGPKTSRYVEIGALLIPYTSLAWWLLLRSNPWRHAVIAVFWIACFFGYSGHWSSKKYRESRQVDYFHLDCVERYYNGTGDGLCQMVTTPEILDRARKLDAKFTRQLTPDRYREGL